MRHTPSLHDFTSLVRDVVGATEIAPEAGFFEIGGDSLAALELSAAIETSWGVSIGIDVVMTAADLGDLHADIVREVARLPDDT
ncbi:acyl carrier protein [Streptomyces sviceus]|uniref:acyl carrier protein n=1 Tax=Streptomyces TaxID=1883 RepID=UPI00369DBC0C